MATKKTPGTALSPEVRAQHSLSFENEGKQLTFEETKARLAILRDDSRNLTEIADIESREVVHKSYMLLKNTRITIENTGKAARADALAFQKAVISKEKELVDIIADEESRLKKLRDDFDSIEEARLAEIEEAERQRKLKVEADIRAMTEAPLEVIGKPAADIDAKLAWLLEQDDESFEGEDLERAQNAKRTSVDRLRAMLTDARQREADEAERAAREEAQRKREEEIAEAQRKLDEQQASIAAAQKKLDDDKAAAEEAERARNEAAERERQNREEAERHAEEQRLADEAAEAERVQQAERDRQAREEREAREAADAAEMERIVATVTLDEAIRDALEWMSVAGGETSLAYRKLDAAFSRYQEK